MHAVLRDGTSTGGRHATERLLRKHAKCDGIFAVNDPAALGARAALVEAGLTGVTVVGFDGSREGKAAVKVGKLYATPIQYPDQIGIETVRAIVRHFNGEALPTEMLIPTSLYRKKASRAEPIHDPMTRPLARLTC
ncbi:MAG: substrate-binding domain-containing protein [Verrucomicrobia bacterium]|nr:substrate-binding domain-containing protein [Verrucomicrobiota bacterium]